MAIKIPNPKIIFTNADSGFLAKATKQGDIKVSKLFEDAPPHIKGAIWQHEVGHLTFGHHKIDRKAFNAAQRLQLELDADRFAAKAGSDIKAALQFAIESNASPHGRKVLRQRLTALEETPRYVYMAKAAKGFGQHKFEAILPKLKNFASRKNAIFAGAIAGGVAGIALLAGAITSPDSKEKFDPTAVKGISPIPRRDKGEQSSWLDFLFNKKDLNQSDEDRILSPELEDKIFTDGNLSNVEYRKYLERLRGTQREESSAMALKTENIREALDEVTWWKDPDSLKKTERTSGLTVNPILNQNQTRTSLDNIVIEDKKVKNNTLINRALDITSSDTAESISIEEEANIIWGGKDNEASSKEVFPQFRRKTKDIDSDIDIFKIASKAPVYEQIPDTVSQTNKETDSFYDIMSPLPENKKLQDTMKGHVRWTGDKEKEGKKFIVPMISNHRKNKGDKSKNNYSDIFSDEIIRRDINKEKNLQDRFNNEEFSAMFSEEGLHPGFTKSIKDQSTSSSWNVKAHSQFGSGYRGNPDMEFEKQISKRFDETISGSMSEKERTKQLKQQFKWYSSALDKFGENVNTGHKRILISKEVFDEEEIEKLGFMRVNIAIPETGQSTFSSFRNPDSLFHIHNFEKSWTMHKDNHHSSTMMIERMKRRRQREAEEKARKHKSGIPLPERDIFDDVGAWSEDAWETISTFAAGAPHVVTEGLPGAYYYMRGKITGANSMALRLQEEIDPRFFELENMVKEKLASTNTAYNKEDGLHPGSEGLGAEAIRENSEFGSGYTGRMFSEAVEHSHGASQYANSNREKGIWSKISSVREDFWYVGRKDNSNIIREILNNDRLVSAYEGRGALNSAIGILGIKQRYNARKANKLSIELDNLRNSKRSQGQGLHPFSNGLGAGSVRYYSDFGSSYQGPNELIKEQLGGPAKILAGTTIASALAYNAGRKKLSAIVGVFGAAAGLSSMAAGSKVLGEVEGSAIPTLIGSAGVIASGTALTISAISKSRTYEETLGKAFGKRGGDLFKKAPYALWMAGGAADVVTADSFEEAAWEAGEFGSSFVGWKAGAHLYEKYVKKAADSKLLKRFSHKGLPGIALHLAGLAGSTFLTSGYRAGFNRPIEEIEGLHPNSDSVGARSVQMHSDFGSPLKPLLERKSLGVLKTLFRGTPKGATSHKPMIALDKLDDANRMVEEFFEKIRKKEFSSRPSRLDSSYWSPIKDIAEKYAKGPEALLPGITKAEKTWKKQSNEAIQQISGLHPGDEGLGTKTIRDITDFGSIIKKLFNRGSVKAAKEISTESLSTPATKLIAAMKGGGSKEEVLERAYESIGARRMTDALEYTKQTFTARGHDIKSFGSEFMQEQAAKVEREGMRAAEDLGIVYAGKGKVTDESMIQEFHELLEVAHSKAAKGKPKFGTHVSEEVIKDEAFLSRYISSDVFKTMKTLREQEGTLKGYDIKKLKGLIKRAEKDPKTMPEFLEKMKYRKRTLEIYENIPNKFDKLGSVIEGIHPNSNNSASANMIRKHSDFGSGYRNINAMMPKRKASVLSGQNIARQDAINEAVNKTPTTGQSEVVKSTPVKSLNDKELAIRRNKKFREISTAAVGAGLRAAHNAGKGHRGFSSTMSA